VRRLPTPFLSTLFIGLLATAVPATGFAQTVTFAPLACTTGGWVNLGPSYSENGVTLTTQTGFATWCADNPDYAGNNLLIGWEGNNATLALSGMGGGTFALSSIDLAHAYSGQFAAEAVNFVGHTLGGGTVSQLFMLAAQDGPTSFATYMFGADFTDLTSVEFGAQVRPFYQFANIQLNAVTATPEPASMLLLATGLVGVFGFARRKHPLR
jgi:hypothetical protein